MSTTFENPNVETSSGADPSVSHELCRFATNLLEACGGLVEWEVPDQAGTAILPSEIGNIFGVKEEVTLSPRQEPGGLCLGLSSEFLDQSDVALRSMVPRIGNFTIPDHYLKGGDLQAAIDRTFHWQNARVRVREWAPQLVTYHHWWFFATLKSEDVWESRLSVTVNAASQAVVELPDFLTLPDLAPSDRPLPVDPQLTFDTAVRRAQTLLLQSADGFLARMESSLTRDLKRLKDYYGALKKEASANKRRASAEPTDEELKARKQVVDLELQRKTGELAERYVMSATIEPLIVTSLEATVLAVELSVQRKQAVCTHWIYWNPLAKQFEPFACSTCGRGTYSPYFMDTTVAPQCTDCHDAPPSNSGTNRITGVKAK